MLNLNFERSFKNMKWQLNNERTHAITTQTYITCRMPKPFAKLG